MSATDVCTVRDLRKSFGGVAAVQGVSLAVAPGLLTGLIGPNGSGKSTVMNLIGGQLRIDAGSVAIGDVDVTTMRPERRAALGLARMFQQPRLVVELSPLDNIALGAWAGSRGWTRALSPGRWRRARRAAREQAEALGVEGLLERRTPDLSHVERRMIEMARVVASGARLVLLDEPMAGLDAAEKRTFVATIQALRSADRGVLVVEHDVAVMTRLCDRMYCLARGEVIAEGTATEVVASPDVRSLYVGTRGTEQREEIRR